MNKAVKMKKELANHEIVTLAVYLLGEDTQRVDTEDVVDNAEQCSAHRLAGTPVPPWIFAPFYGQKIPVFSACSRFIGVASCLSGLDEFLRGEETSCSGLWQNGRVRSCGRVL